MSGKQMSTKWDEAIMAAVKPRGLWTFSQLTAAHRLDRLRAFNAYQSKIYFLASSNFLELTAPVPELSKKIHGRQLFSQNAAPLNSSLALPCCFLELTPPLSIPKSKPATSFTKFSELPSELRRLIWSHSFPKAENVVLNLPSRLHNSQIVESDLVHWKLKTPEPPAILWVNHESRTEALSHYMNITLGTQLPALWFRPNVDTLSISIVGIIHTMLYHKNLITDLAKNWACVRSLRITKMMVHGDEVFLLGYKLLQDRTLPTFYNRLDKVLTKGLLSTFPCLEKLRIVMDNKGWALLYHPEGFGVYDEDEDPNVIEERERLENGAKIRFKGLCRLSKDYRECKWVPKLKLIHPKIYEETFWNSPCWYDAATERVIPGHFDDFDRDSRARSDLMFDQLIETVDGPGCWQCRYAGKVAKGRLLNKALELVKSLPPYEVYASMRLLRHHFSSSHLSSFWDVTYCLDGIATMYPGGNFHG